MSLLSPVRLTLALVFATATVGRAAPVDFAREVRPLLSRACFKCHGPDEKTRKAKLRLDVRGAALAPARSGKSAIVPGKPSESELLLRIHNSEPGETMPPPSAKLVLTAAEKSLLERWIHEGAAYVEHWAFVPPRLTPLPTVRRGDWPRHPIDHFVLARLEAAGLGPSPEADRPTLLRRVSLDLIGLPPTAEEAEAFARDPAPDAYERAVDRLLASPHYGERWARRWLDLARYADTNGYEKDRVRSIWPYRDWVIHALNRDLPFNQFTIEQLAGDLLPNATPDQRIATGFHRNTMLNEEGGIDPLEFRFHAMTDRVSTTGTAWLGLTLGCVQCHTHKYDPIPQREYYAFLALLNNADEPEMPVTTPEQAARRAEVERLVAERTAALPGRFPAGGGIAWTVVKPREAKSAEGATTTIRDDGSVVLSGKSPQRDTYTIVFDTDFAGADTLRLEALTDPSLPSTGPGRTPHGNFVLSEVVITAAALSKPETARSIRVRAATADAAQELFPPSAVHDGDPTTGWAIHVAGAWNVHRTLTLALDGPTGLAGGTRWTVRLEQQHGLQHTLGRFRLALGRRAADGRSEEVRRREHLQQRFAEWRKEAAAKTVPWTVLRPVSATSNLPKLDVLADGSVLASGDMSKRDVYDLVFRDVPRGATALRLEVLPHDSLPKRGPGRVYYEGPVGDFFLSEILLHSETTPVKIARAVHTFASGNSGADKALDGDPHTGWSVNGGQGRAHAAVFRLAEPFAGGDLRLRMVFERYYAASLGHFRVSCTTDRRPAEASTTPAEVEELLTRPGTLGSAEEERLLRHFVQVAPELAAEREAIQKLRNGLPTEPTTLVFAERPADHPRPTQLHHRGEFLQPRERVEPGVLSVLPPLPPGAPANRLALARWLVDPGNPLVGRVTMNRHWAAFFGRGLVRTMEDFGFQGEPPTHPEVLDWLALELVRRGWSIKSLHRLLVTSATYRQTSAATAELLAQDPTNRLLGRSPRPRLEAELVRDAALRASGLLSPRLGGPSVFPPQPPGVTSEGTYGALAWKASEGPDRYRRGLYTFSKRTAPFAMFTTFDAPSGEACVARREVSNTPLQALTLLNDAVFLEAARALGQEVAEQPGDDMGRATWLFRRVLTRPPTADERSALVAFARAQEARFAGKELDPSTVAGPGTGNAARRAAWTATARVVLNLDEAVTRP